MRPSQSLFLPFFLLFLTPTSTSTSTSATADSLLRIVPEETAAVSDGDGDDVSCDSWRLSVETNNAGSWKTIPEKCLGYVEAYINGERYTSDSDVIRTDALAFARSVEVAGDGKDVWIFDVDETLLSNVPYYADNKYGLEVFNETSFNEWVNVARAPALSASFKLCEELIDLGFHLVLLTGRTEPQRNVTEANLSFAGYHSWTKLILREASDIGKPAVVYKAEKRAMLEAQGYRIHGNSGDQWSDLLGLPMAIRSFKLPNPMYFVG
ncbi:acid phosphatase 1-like [Typha latifolia]|uniref:acid phosphatase 1-like n=1 Tax=Typha latifolia TaxID=4733 RepID=UPI003C2F0D3D